MKHNSLLANSKGFGMVDVMLASVVLTVVVITVSIIVQKNLLNMTWNRQTRRASVLADMVIQKYQYLATTQFDALPGINQTNANPKEFFASPDNMGYDGLTITTVTDVPNADGARKLKVTIRWGTSDNQKFEIIKYLSSGVGEVGGAPVYVYALEADGRGIPNCEIHADHHYNPAWVNSRGNNEVIGYTDANGYVALQNVSVNPSQQPMLIEFKKTGSDLRVKKSDPAYVQGYYAAGSGGGTWGSKWITVSQTKQNVVYFKVSDGDIRPLGSISGTLINTSGSSRDGMEISMSGYATDNNYIQDRHNEWPIWSRNVEANGKYEFNNLAPTSQLVIQPVGLHGSNITTAPSDPGFEQGYTGYGGNSRPSYCGGDVCDYLYTTSMPDPAIDIQDYDVPVHAMGSLNLLVQDNHGSPLPNASVDIYYPDGPYGDRQTQFFTFPTDSTGHLHLYNVYIQSSESVNFRSTSAAPTSCASPGGYLYDHYETAHAPGENNITLTLDPGATVEGTLKDQNSGAALHNLLVTVRGLDGSTLGQSSDATGHFTLCGISPKVSEQNPDWPQVQLTISDPMKYYDVAATLNGRVTDADFPSIGLANQSVIGTVSDVLLHDHVDCGHDTPGNPTQTIHTDSSGNYGSICGYFPFYTTESPTATGGPTDFSVGILPIETSKVNGGLMTPYDGYWSSNPVNFTQITSQTIDLKATLYRQSVTGVVRDSSSGEALKDISFDACGPSPCHNACPVTTDASGQFGPVPVCVSDRHPNQAGTVILEIPGGVSASNTGYSYQGSVQSKAVPTPANPTIPLNFTFSLTRNGGGM